MAIQVSGTEVISNARNISNVGTVTATNFVGGGAGITGITSSPFGPSARVTDTPDAIFTSTGTWTKPSVAADSWITLYMVGGGGSGASNSPWANGAAGGAAVLFSGLASGFPASMTVTVGSGGAAKSAAGGDGNSGGNTSITLSGVAVTALGGPNGAASNLSRIGLGGVYSVPANGLPPFATYVTSDFKGGSSQSLGPGGNSVFGGGAGGSGNGSTETGGTSTYAGNGGSGGIAGAAGAAGGGGGGGSNDSNASGAGGAGRVYFYYG